MWSKNKHGFAAQNPAGNQKNFGKVNGALSRDIKAALSKLESTAAGKVEIDRHPVNGRIRYLSADGKGLFNQPVTGDLHQHVRAFLAQPETETILELHGVTLNNGAVADFSTFKRVELVQYASVPGIDKPLRVRGGTIHAIVNAKGHVLSVENGVRPGDVPARRVNIVSEAQAIAAAKAQHVTTDVEVKASELTLSSHEVRVRKNAKLALKGGPKTELAHRLDPTYEIVLYSKPTPERIASAKLYLVDGKTGKVVHQEEKIRFSQVGPSQAAATEPPTKYFPLTPDAKVDLNKQLIDYTVADLKDPTKLENSRLKMLVRKNGKWAVATAKSDGTWNYTIKDPEFGAVVCFIAINEGLVEQEKLCGIKFPQLPVYVGDPNVRDNAYLDPVNWESRIGVGSGPGGLRKDIAFDKMVPRHEVLGHGSITVLAPGKDLPGDQGGGTHEAGGDFEALIFEYADAVKFASRINKPFGVAEVKADKRIIGPYSLDGGIRVQRNKKKFPGDMTGEVHDDGEVIGGALCDMLQAIIEVENDVEKGRLAAHQIWLKALAQVPSHKVLFVDVLRALINADQTDFAGKYRQVVEKAFKDHGIVLGGTRVSKPRKRVPARRRKAA